MSELVTPSGTVHWIGTGLSTGSGLAVVVDRVKRVVLWGRTVAKAEACLDRLGLTGRAATGAYDLPALADQLAAGDVVVSMLPATEHAELLSLCTERGAHFACSSYTSDEIADLAPAAGAAGIVVLTESGLDPGIDHLLAHKLVAQARAAIGDGEATAEFTSYCGGVPAVANEFRYRFSWAPRGVLMALCSPARYIEDGAERVAERPWEATGPYVLDGETFEVYPNRDSVPFVDQYEIPSTWRLDTFVRGTLRLDGWRDAWSDVFAVLREGDADRITALATELAATYPTTDADRDRVVLAVALRVRAASGAEWAGEYVLDAIGDEDDSAMARCVSLPLAFGVSELVDGALTPGLHRAVADESDVDSWLAFLRDNGVECAFTSS